MRTITAEKIAAEVERLFVTINRELSPDVTARLRECREKETCPLAVGILGKLAENLDAAREIGVPICQDTGMAVLFAEVGKDVRIEGGGSFEDIVNEGVRRAYVDGALRLSVVGDPLRRVNTGTNTPCVLYTDIVEGDKIRLTAAPKGFGSENMSALKMFTPAATADDIMDFVCDTVKKAGSNPCPPIVCGVGIGGTSDKAAVLAKKALTRPLDDRSPDPFYADLEDELLRRVNALGIGPQGFGGDTTALAVKIERFATHIAGLPVAVNINCHVARHAASVI